MTKVSKCPFVHFESFGQYGQYGQNGHEKKYYRIPFDLMDDVQVGLRVR